jgi:hypothetical protein
MANISTEEQAVIDEALDNAKGYIKSRTPGTIKVLPQQGDYDSLLTVLTGAFEQASSGKGKERHADNDAFENQKICQITRWLGEGPASPVLFQVVKKALEADRLDPAAAIHELYGTIVYASAAIIVLKEHLE